MPSMEEHSAELRELRRALRALYPISEEETRELDQRIKDIIEGPFGLIMQAEARIEKLRSNVAFAQASSGS